MRTKSQIFSNLMTDSDLIDLVGNESAIEVKSKFVAFNIWQGKRHYKIYVTNDVKQMVFSDEFKNFVGGYMAGRYFEFSEN
jgi:putative heme iron utilization protein